MVDIKLDKLDAFTTSSVLKYWICPVVSVTVALEVSFFKFLEYLCCDLLCFFYEDIFQCGLGVIDFYDCNYFFERRLHFYWWLGIYKWQSCISSAVSMMQEGIWFTPYILTFLTLLILSGRFVPYDEGLSLTERLMLLHPGFFRNPFSLNAHLGFFKRLNYLCLLEYTYLPYQRDISAVTNVQVLILMMTAVFSAFH